MILDIDLILQSLGISGLLIFYIVIAKLSARMGKGLSIAPYYKWDYAACLITLSAIPVHVYLHQKYDPPHVIGAHIDLQGLYFLLILFGNIIVIVVSIRYWWWLKSELFVQMRGKKDE